MLFREEREGTLCDKINLIVGNNLFNRRHDVIKAYPKIGIMPTHFGSFVLGHQETQVIFNFVNIQRFIIDISVDAEAARIRTAHTRDHRHDFD